jgi:hypothetical protein
MQVIDKADKSVGEVGDSWLSPMSVPEGEVALVDTDNIDNDDDDDEDPQDAVSISSPNLLFFKGLYGAELALISLLEVKASDRWGKMVLYLLALAVFPLDRLFRRIDLGVRLG